MITSLMLFMDADHSFLYGAVALQAGLIDSQQFSEVVEACRTWEAHRDGLLPDLFVRRGWLQPSARVHLEYLVERKLRQYAGDVKAGLASITHEVERSRASLGDEQLRCSLAMSPRLGGSYPSAKEEVSAPESQSRYVLTRLHATGGIGRVWLAHDVKLGRDVALKELRPEQADVSVLRTRFLREAQITSQLAHPGIVPVYELALRRDTGQPFYTMRFVRGRTLGDVAKMFHQKRAAGQNDPLEFSTMLNAFVVVCKTVAYAHARGVIHRDLKGQNVILGDFGEVVVLDWGLAKLVEQPEQKIQTGALGLEYHLPGKDDLTAPGDTLGTPGYMAPEQATGELNAIDRRTDVYGLGAILYHLLTGQPPFAGPNMKEVLQKVQFEEPVPPQQLWKEAPFTLQSACLRALAKQPSARFASASELAAEVEHWQEVQRKEAIEALRASEALYHSLVESIPIYVWRKDADGRFTFANRWFCESFARTSEQLIGRSDFDLFPTELAEKYRRDDAQVRQTGQTLQLTEEHFSPTRARLVVEVIKTPIYDARGQIVGTQGIFWDVTSWSCTQAELRAKQGLPP